MARAQGEPDASRAAEPRVLKQASWTQRLGDAARNTVGWLRRPRRQPSSGKRAARGKTSASGARETSLRPGVIRHSGFERPELEASRWTADASLAALARTLANPDPVARARALGVIAEFSERQATFLVSASLHDPDASVRRAAVSAATRISTTRIVAPLIVALDDPSPEIRRAVARAIEEVTGRPVELSDSDETVSPDRLRELETWWKRQRLAELLRELE